MKTFDLTFNGTVLPDYDREQVKRDFALLFSIEDRSLIEDIFSGETLALRHNLDRKTAADYFRKITQLGGEATLVNSNERGAGADFKIGKLEQVDGCAPRIIREPGTEQDVNTDSPFQQQGGMQRSWPVSMVRTIQSQPEQPGSIDFTSASEDEPSAVTVPEAAPGTSDDIAPDARDITVQQDKLPVAPSEDTPSDVATQANLALINDGEELNKLRALAAKTKNELQQKAAELQQQKEQILRIVSENLSRVEQLNQATLLRNETALSELQSLREKENLATETEIARVKEQEKLARDRGGTGDRPAGSAESGNQEGGICSTRESQSMSGRDPPDGGPGDTTLARAPGRSAPSG